MVYLVTPGLAIKVMSLTMYCSLPMEEVTESRVFFREDSAELYVARQVAQRAFS